VASAAVGGVDEIEDLRQSVDQMAQQIQRLPAGLQSYARRHAPRKEERAPRP
jgi:hypothetical protein